MTEYKEVDLQTFLDTVDQIEYRNQDITEAFQFGCDGIIGCYRKAKHRWARYFVVYEDERPIVTVMLQRDGHIIFFISKDVNNSIALIRELIRLATSVVNCCGAIITKTANWYEEAKRVNRLVGFREWQIYNNYTLWVKE